MVKYGTYPVTYGLIDWISQRLDALDFGNYSHWYRQGQLIKLHSDYKRGAISGRAAARLLSIYNEKNGTRISLNEIEDLDDTFVFSPANDEIVFCDNIRDVIETGEALKIQEPLDALACEENKAKWIILYRTGEGLIHTLKTPFIKDRKQLKDFDQFADGLSSGDNKTFVFPDEVHGIIRQEKGV